MFFSPDGKRIALLTPLQEAKSAVVLPGGDEIESTGPRRRSGPRRWGGGRLRSVPYQWWIHDRASGETTALASLRMPGALAQLMMYFDQFSPSHAFWSPDSRYLVTASRPSGRGATAQIWVVDTEENEPPVAVAEGRFAVWSPQ